MVEIYPSWVYRPFDRDGVPSLVTSAAFIGTGMWIAVRYFDGQSMRFAVETVGLWDYDLDTYGLSELEWRYVEQHLRRLWTPLKSDGGTIPSPEPARPLDGAVSAPPRVRRLNLVRGGKHP